MLVKDDVTDVERNAWEALQWDRAGYTVKNGQATWLKLERTGPDLWRSFREELCAPFEALGPLQSRKDLVIMMMVRPAKWAMEYRSPMSP